MEARSDSELDRRTLLKGVTAGAVGAGVATAMTVEAPEAAAQDKGAVRDPNLHTEAIKFKSGEDMISGFVARPKAAGKYGTVILIPDIFGMTDYARETAAQLAQAGLACLAVDFYSRAGQPPADFAALREFVPKNAPDRQIVADGLAGVAYMKKQSFTNGKYGVTGFCMGGRITLLLAASSPDVVAASPYYGPVRAANPVQMSAIEMTDKIRAAVQGHYGATDMNPKPDDVRAFYEKLKETNPHGEYFIYQGAGHAFHSYGRPSFNAEAAATAWGRTLAFFQKHLK